MSEYMNSLKIPTTRSLGVIMTDEKIKRDFSYSNNAEYERGAITCRFAPNFIRFGNFELLLSWENTKMAEQLFDYLFKYFN